MGKKSKLPPGSRVERLPTRIFEEDQPEFEVGEGEITPVTPAMEKRDALFEQLRGPRFEVGEGEVTPISDAEQKRDAFYATGAGRRAEKGSRSPMQEINAKAFKALQEKRSKKEAPTLVRDRHGMTTQLSDELREQPTGWNTITTQSGRKLRVPTFNPQGYKSPQQFIDELPEEEPRFLDGVLEFMDY
tara:strand:+ start:21366 stop:21929 length:564 start_codon:yes stop_codon:yes gene_type:complete